MISFIGFLFNLVPHVLIVVLYGAEFEGTPVVDTWFYVMAGVAYFLYMVCDNCDGK